MRLAGLSCRAIIYVMFDEKGGSGRKGVLNEFRHKKMMGKFYDLKKLLN